MGGTVMVTAVPAMLPLVAALGWFAQPGNWWVVIQVALGLGFVIFVHELGHFLVAKACGVKCEKFFLGFDIGGLKLFSFTHGETEYGIGILPLGGYVKMLGQDDNPAAATTEAERARAAVSGDLPPEPVAGPHPVWDPRSYPAQTVPERMAIISAGVVMNVIFAFLMASLAFGLGVRELTCAVSAVRPGGAAWRAGLRTGDEITAVGDRTNPIFTDLQKGVTLGDVAAGVVFQVHRPADGSEQTLRLFPDTDLGVPTVGITSPFSLRLPTDISGGLPGAAGRAVPALEGGDTIRAVDGQAVASYAELIAALSTRSDRPVNLEVARAGAAGAATTLTVVVPPQRQLVTGLEMEALAISAVQDGSPAAAAGVRPGDRLVGVDGGPVGDPTRLEHRLRALQGREVALTLERDGQPLTVTVTPRSVTWLEEARFLASPVALSSIGVALPVDSVVAAVVPGGPGDRAGIVPGERFTSVRFIDPADADGGRRLRPLPLGPGDRNWPYVLAELQQAPPGLRLELELAAADGNAARKVELVPEPAGDLFVVDRGLVFEPDYRVVQAGSWLGAIRRGARQALDDLGLVSRFLRKVTSNQISPRLLGGPIEIAKQAGKSASEGFSRLLLFLTMLSANLAVVNFLPIPVLDGGHMVFLVYEWIRGKPPSEGVVVALSYLGLALILSLMIFVFGLDLGLIARR
ncbi:MAG: PDZ domain-containing protein [Planctomycetia bacterium]|nr:PDZ domain-containing protein [Planctomycetia bacterium]